MNEQISQERAGEIALAVIKVIWSNRGVDLEPRKFNAELGRLKRKTGINEQYLAYFFGQELLPLIFLRATDVQIDVNVHYRRDLGSDFNAGEIALALLKAEGIDLRPDQLKPRLERLSERTGIALDELMTFMVQEIITAAMTATTGQSYQITAQGPQTKRFATGKQWKMMANPEDALGQV